MDDTKKIRYCFVDPINSDTSGITRYTLDAVKILEEAGIFCSVIARNKLESIEDFRWRVSDWIDSIPGKGLILEAPETMASTLHVSSDINVHIRLHFSKVFGAFIEGKYIDKKLKKEEQQVIDKASFISSPSVIGAELAKKFYSLKDISIYQNPLKKELIVTGAINRCFDVGFVGRWQSLKGVPFIKEVLRIRPDLKFIVATDVNGWKELSSFGNVKLLDPRKKALVYSQSNCVIVPSYFETASMVAIEAILAGAKVVTWRHIGVCEYIDKPYIFKAEPFDIQALVHCIDSAICNIPSSSIDGAKAIDEFNNDFVSGIYETMNGNVYKTSLIANDNVGKDLSFLDGVVMKDTQELSSFQRKFRKLRKHPVLFFKDAYKKKKGHVYVPSIGDRKSILLPKSESESKKGRRRASIFCDIANWDSVSFHDYGPSKKEFRPIFLFDKNRYKSFYYRKILEQIYSHNDFMPFRRDFSGRGYFDLDRFPVNLTLSNFVDSVPFKERCKINNISVVFLFDCFEPKVFDFFKSASPFVKVVSVYTQFLENKSFSFINDLDSIDALVVSEKIKIASKLPKLYLYSESSHIHLVLRKLMQEYNPRNPNYLLPLYGVKKYYPDLEKFDTERWGGLIIINKAGKRGGESVHCFHDFLENFSTLIEEVYVREDIYLAYKSICDDIELKGNLFFFLKRSIKDGCMYRVKEI